MGTIATFLSSVSTYPIPNATLLEIATRRGLDLGEEVTSVINTTAYRLAKADVMMWLSSAPNVSQGGISYSFSESERKEFRRQAEGIYAESGEKKVRYGYKGSRL